MKRSKFAKWGIATTLANRTIGLSLVIALASCGKKDGAPGDAGVSDPDAREHYLPSAAQRSQASLGMGYDRARETFVGKCAKGGIEFVGRQEANIQFDRKMSQKEMLDSLGLEVGGKAFIGGVYGELSGKYAKSASSNSFSDSMTYRATYTFKNAKMVYDGLTPVGEIARANWENWEATCGHEYIDQIELGAALYITMKIEFSSEEDKLAFEAKGKAIGPTWQAEFATAYAKSSFGKSATVSVMAYQMGGNVSRLSSIFNVQGAQITDDGNTGKAVHPIISCSMERLQDCQTVLSAAIRYATDTSDPNAFPQQINFQTLDTSSPGGPAMLKYITKPWQTVGIFQKPQIMKDLVKESRKQLGNAAFENFQYNNRITGLLTGKIRLSEGQFRNVRKMEAEVSKNLAEIGRVANICYSVLDACADAVADMKPKLKTFTKEELTIVPETYAQFCDFASLPIHMKSLGKTIRALENLAVAELALANKSEATAAEIKAQLHASDRCGEVEAVLKTLPSITYRGKSVDGVEEKIEWLEPFTPLVNLKSLDLRDNEITDVRPLEKLPLLYHLNLTGNKIEFIEPVTRLKNLKILKIAGNPTILDIDKAFAMDGLAVRILTTAEACNSYRKVLAHIFPNRKVLLDTLALTNEVPFKVVGDKGEFADTKECNDATVSLLPELKTEK